MESRLESRLRQMQSRQYLGFRSISLAALFACALQLLAYCCGALAQVPAQVPSPVTSQFSSPVPAQTPPQGAALQEEALPADTKMEADLSYGVDPLQKLDVYTTPQAKSLPVILMVHGGAWYMGDKKDNGVAGNKAAYFLRHGYVFVSVNYRLWPKAKVPDQIADLTKAIAYVQAKASQWGGDGRRVTLMGHSAGAHLITLLTADPKLAFRSGAKPWLGTVSLDSAALDVGELMKQPHQGFYDRVFGTNAEFRRNCSPTLRLSGKPLPVLLVYCTLRDEAPPQNKAFAARAKACGGRVELLPVAIEHAEINRDLGLPGKYTDAVEKFLNSLL